MGLQSQRVARIWSSYSHACLKVEITPIFSVNSFKTDASVSSINFILGYSCVLVERVRVSSIEVMSQLYKTLIGEATFRALVTLLQDRGC